MIHLIITICQVELHPGLPHHLRYDTAGSAAQGRDHGHTQDGCGALNDSEKNIFLWDFLSIVVILTQPSPAVSAMSCDQILRSVNL